MSRWNVLIKEKPQGHRCRRSALTSRPPSEAETMKSSYKLLKVLLRGMSERPACLSAPMRLSISTVSYFVHTWGLPRMCSKMGVSVRLCSRIFLLDIFRLLWSTFCSKCVENLHEDVSEHLTTSRQGFAACVSNKKRCALNPLYAKHRPKCPNLPCCPIGSVPFGLKMHFLLHSAGNKHGTTPRDQH